MVLQALLSPWLFTIKKPVDLVTDNFLLQVVALLGGLSSETSGLFQPMLIGQVAFLFQ